MSASGAELVSTWASVAASLGTVGAFAIAGLVVFREARRDRLEKERLQASRVAAWLQVVNGDDRRLRRTYAQRRIIALVVRNGSDLPVYDTQLWWALRSGQHDVKDMGVLPPNTEIATGLFAEKRSDDWIVATGTTFVDTAGRAWTRTFSGQLLQGRHEPEGTVRRQRSAATDPTAPDSAAPDSAAPDSIAG